VTENACQLSSTQILLVWPVTVSVTGRVGGRQVRRYHGPVVTDKRLDAKPLGVDAPPVNGARVDRRTQGTKKPGLAHRAAKPGGKPVRAGF
jgi:hypothetical protein